MDVDHLQILMTSDTLGGVWSYSLNLAKALEPFGVHIHLATMGAMPDQSQKAQAAQRSNLTLHSSTWQLEWMDDPWEEVAAAGHWLKYLQSEIRPDLVHLNDYSHGSLPWNVPVLMVGHSCVPSWWQAVKKEEVPAQYDAYMQKIKAGLQAADVVVAPSGHFMEQLSYFYGPFNQQQVIYNSTSANDIKPAAKQPFILSAGRLWDEAKNISFCDMIAARGLDWPLIVAGEDRHPNGKQISYQHLHTMGKLSHQDLTQRLAVAAIYMHPAKYEPFGLSVLEAAHAGCALILGDIPSLRELWQDAALFISTTDVEEAHRQVQELLGNKPQRQQLAQKALQRARQYSQALHGKQYFELYQELIREARQSVLPETRTERRAANR